MKTILASFFLSLIIPVSNACTNLLVTSGASADGSNIITYLADSHILYGELYFYPAADHTEGTMRDIYNWDSGKFHGRFKEAKHTLQVIGNMNEHQLVIAETTFGGRKELQDTSAILDYGSLIYITLQRASTAREAIKIMTSLVNEYGYYSSGESFSIADPNQVWLMEMIGKGVGNKGAVWVALRVPDGYICAHANESRIRTFSLKDKNNCIYSTDVISFRARRAILKGKTMNSVLPTHTHPMTFTRYAFAKRACGVSSAGQRPARIFLPILFREEDTNARLPLWIKPDKPIGVKEAMSAHARPLRRNSL